MYTNSIEIQMLVSDYFRIIIKIFSGLKTNLFFKDFVHICFFNSRILALNTNSTVFSFCYHQLIKIVVMKRNIVALCIATTLAFSCSAEKIVEDIAEEQEKLFDELIEEENDGETGEDQETGTDQSAMLYGKWEVTELKINSDTASDQMKFGKQILDHLTNKECFIISFTFNTDLTVIAENSVNHLEVNVGGTGLDIPCPEMKDTESSVYAYDGENLTLEDGDGKELMLGVTVEDETMTVDAKDLDLPNFKEDGLLIFTKVEE